MIWWTGAVAATCLVFALIGSAVYTGLDPKPAPICAKALLALPPGFSQQAQEAWTRMRPYAPACRQ